MNDNVQFLGSTDHGGGNELTFLLNLQAPTEATGWGSDNTPNNKWGWSRFVPSSMNIVAWGAFIDPRPAYLLQSPVNPCNVATNYFVTGVKSI